MISENKKFMLRAMYEKRHMLALERGDELKAKEWLDKISDLENNDILDLESQKFIDSL